MRHRAAALAALAFPLALAVVAGVALAVRDASAQRFDPRRPGSWVVGPPPGPSPMRRVDGRRSGLSKTPLPSGTLRVAWRKTTGLTLDQPALSGPDGTLAVISVRGDVTFLDEAGEERGAVRLGAPQVGPAAMTSDGTVVYTTSGGDVVGVRRGSTQPRFSTRIGGERNVKAAPLALDDGGVVIATMTDLIVLDSEGNVRARVSLPDPPDAPLLASSDKVLAVTKSGAIFGWSPGREPVRLGSFGAPIDVGAALRDASTLVAVIDGNQLAEVDIAHGGLSARSLAPQGLYLGPPAVRTAAGVSLATVLGRTASRGFVVTIDGAGQELVRAPIESFTPVLLPDGGAAPLTVPPQSGTLVDERGAVAFASTDGHIGVVSPEGAVETIGEPLCTKGGSRSGVSGLTPFGSGAFAVTCDGGVVLGIVGASAPAEPRSQPSPGPSASAPGKLRSRPALGD